MSGVGFTAVKLVRRACGTRFAGFGPAAASSGRITVGALARLSTAPKGKDQKPEELGALSELVRDFLDPAEFVGHLKKRGIDFYTGVPDSLLKDLCGYIEDTEPAANHVIAANEGAAVALASGYHLGTGKYPMVYLQNSGLGNTINPLLSLCDAQVYSIPMLLVIGWRGEPGKKDEPQHRVQGKIMAGLLTELGLSYEVLPDYQEGAEQVVDTAIEFMDRRSQPFVLLVRRQCFEKYNTTNNTLPSDELSMTREAAIESLVKQLRGDEVVVSTTGMASRELFEYRKATSAGHQRDFLTVGSMGHASAIALGLAMAQPNKNVVCLDGDGAALMHLGTLTTVGSVAPSNLIHVVLNNGAHDSVGGQPTVGFETDFLAIATASGYRSARRAETAEEVADCFRQFEGSKGPHFMEVRIKRGARANLGRPTIAPQQNKLDFMRFVQDNRPTWPGKAA